MKSARRAIALGLALVGASARAADPAFVPTDFAWGRAIETSADGPLQTLLLDVSIYRGAVSPDLADLRVFNAAGEVVPHAIRPLGDPSEERGAPAPVALFHVPAGSSLARGAERGMTVRERDIAVEVAADGAIVRVGAGAQPDESAERRPSAYLLDLSPFEKAKRAVVGLDLALAPEPAEFAVALRVETSDDLVHFAPLAARAAVARLDQAGHRIERSQIELPAVTSRYLLLSAAGPLPVEVTAVSARLAPTTVAPPRARERVQASNSEPEASEEDRRVSRSEPKASEDHRPGAREEFLFDLGGPLPVDRVQVDLPVPNTVVEAQLYSAPAADGPWQHHYSGLLYQLDRAEGALRNAPIHVPPIRRRYFKLAVEEKGGGLGGGAPALEVSWMPEQLLFVARGAGPFALGYGRAQVEPARFDASALIASALPPGADPRLEVSRETAKLGAVAAVGDRSVLEPRREPVAPRTIALWGVLVGSVAIVLALSVRLLRRMGEPS